MENSLGLAPSLSRECSLGFISTANFISLPISSGLAPCLKESRKLTFRSECKHTFKKPSAVSLNLLQRKQNLQLASELGFAYTTLEEMVAHAHILTLHLPYREKSTHHIIDRRAFLKMRRGILLINTAHEELVDTGALLWALGEGIVAGYASDVAQDSAEIENLRKHPGVLLTPHSAWNTQETLEHLLRISAENIRAYFSGFPQNIVGEKI